MKPNPPAIQRSTNPLSPLSLLLGVLFLISGVAADGRPNVLLVMVDDLGFSDLGCYGSSIETPNLDALAAGGLRFTQFYNTGRCWPTRASLMTGYYPHQVGHAMQFGPEAPPAYRGMIAGRGALISEVLKPAGYRCYHVGKWHLGAVEPASPLSPLRRGFDRSYVVRSQENFFNPVALYDDVKKVERPGGESPMGDGKYYVTSEFTNRAVEMLREHAAEHAGKPFFLYLAHTAPHFPLHALPGDIDQYRGKFRHGWDVERARRLARLKESGIVGKETELPPRDEDALDWDSLSNEEKEVWDTRMAIHAAMVHRVDVGIGQIVEQLRAMGAFEDTLVLFLSDNGASAESMVRGDGHDPEAPPGSGASYLCLEVSWANACNTPFRLHKMWTHEGGIATPFIAHWPAGIAARGELAHEAGHVIDMMPTIAELAGVTIPDEAGGDALPPMPGRSLVPVFGGREREPHPFLFWEHVGNRAIREGDWKLVAEEGKAWELYDLRTDRNETEDMATKNPEKAEEMGRRWQDFADEIGVVEWGALPQAKRSPGPGYRRK